MDAHQQKVLEAANQPHFNENGLLNPQIPPELQIQAGMLQKSDKTFAT